MPLLCVFTDQAKRRQLQGELGLAAGPGEGTAPAVPPGPQSPPPGRRGRETRECRVPLALLSCVVWDRASCHL